MLSHSFPTSIRKCSLIRSIASLSLYGSTVYAVPLLRTVRKGVLFMLSNCFSHTQRCNIYAAALLLLSMRDCNLCRNIASHYLKGVRFILSHCFAMYVHVVRFMLQNCFPMYKRLSFMLSHCFPLHRGMGFMLQHFFTPGTRDSGLCFPIARCYLCRSAFYAVTASPYLEGSVVHAAALLPAYQKYRQQY